MGTKSGGPCGAGTNAGKGLSRFTRNRNNGQQRREERFPIEVMAVSNHRLEDLGGMNGVRLGKDNTKITCKLEHTDNGGLTASIANDKVAEKVAKIKEFKIFAQDFAKRGYGRVIVTPRGRPLPAKHLLNRNDVGRESNQYDGVIQPFYGWLDNCFIVEAISGTRSEVFRIRSYQLDEQNQNLTKGDKPIYGFVSTGTWILDIPEELARGFSLSGAEIPETAEMEEIIRENLPEDEEYSWEPMVQAMAIALRKALGDQAATVRTTEQCAEALADALATGTNG